MLKRSGVTSAPENPLAQNVKSNFFKVQTENVQVLELLFDALLFELPNPRGGGDSDEGEAS